MTNSTDLNIPVILWGPEPPKHQISQIIAIQNDSIIITASFEGQIIQWNVDESNGIKPNMMLLGHEAAITCLSPTLSSNSTKYVSCCRKGYIRLWDSIDGTCIEAIQHPFVHRKIIPYTFQASSTHSTSYLYCIGDYADVVVIDGNDLNILFTLNSRVEPDWINAITVIKQQNSHDAIIGISISGMIKVWSLSDISNKTDHQNTIFEDESKSLPIKNVKGLSASNLNPKILLLITSSTWQILDINNFNPLIISECSIEAIDGVIIDEDKIAVGFIDGTIALFQLPKHKINGSESNCNNLHVEHPFVFGLLKSSKPPFNVSFNNNFAGFYFDIQQFNDKRAHRFAYRSDESGNIDITKIPDILDSLIIEVQQNKMPSIIKPIFQQSLKNIWANNKSTLPGICETARILSTICSIANDNSVALLSLKENKCILLASRQIFPIIDIQFRPLDDLMMIRCLDDSLYVWQMETANLDRIVTGIIAEEVLEGCKEQIGIFEMDDEAGANSATQMLRAIKNKNLAAVKKIAKKTDANVDIPKHCYQKQQLSQPLKINQLNKFCNESHLLLFNVNEIFKDMNKNDMEHRDSPSTFRKISLSSLISPTKRITVSPGKQKVVVAQNAISDNIAKLLLSLIYDWEMDKSDAIKRGLQKPAVPIHFGIVCHGIQL
uniref:Uncharacterized protein n=1 Tax=Panagrolaimus superbus TaxID=310955 RepID=A0A914YHK6_9BILA